MKYVYVAEQQGKYEYEQSFIIGIYDSVETAKKDLEIGSFLKFDGCEKYKWEYIGDGDWEFCRYVNTQGFTYKDVHTEINSYELNKSFPECVK